MRTYVLFLNFGVKLYGFSKFLFCRKNCPKMPLVYCEVLAGHVIAYQLMAKT